MDYGRRAIVLVVDDDPDARTIAAETLREAGYEVLEAASAERGLEVAWAARPDAVVVDFLMPGQNGVDMVRRLRRDPTTRDTPIVMLTAFAESAYGHRALSAGCDAVMAKPFDVQDLQRIVAHHLRGGLIP